MRVAADPAVEVDEAAIIAFFDGRARQADDPAGPGVTMLQDARSTIALQRNDVEVQALHALLDALQRRGIDRPRTLDVGCGAGRLQAALAPRLGDYLGIDGAAALIAAAAARAQAGEAGGAVRHAVHNLAAPGLAALSDGRPPQLVLMSGILIYLNDASVQRLLREIAAIAHGPCTLVLREPVGIDARLTLKDHWSDELRATYNAIYRTGDELRRCVADAFGARLVACTQRWLYEAAELNNRAETRQALTVATVAAPGEPS